MARAGGGRAGRGPAKGRRAAPRAPRQERGRRRVEAILDAAAALIWEHGVGGLTVHGIARRAGTSIGSMYHFFPDLDAVVAGLAERDVRSFEPVIAALAARPAREWALLSAAAAADAIVTPIYSFLKVHPHTLLLLATPRAGARFHKRREEMRTAGLDLVERIFAARLPVVRPPVRRARAAVIVGTIEGVLTLVNRARVDPGKASDELKRAVTAYLEAMEGTR